MKIEETNKLIAEFLGYVNTTPTDKDFNIYEGKNKVLPNLIETNFEKRFHTDWNWLMEVVEKIESLGYSTELKFITGLGNTMFFISGGAEVPLNRRIFKTKIEAVYNACVTFIEWYNKQK